MFSKVRTGVAALAAMGALALGGSAIAGAADNGSSTGSGSSSGTATTQQRPPGPHMGASGEREQALSADVAAKVKQAALAKLPGGTVIRTETNVDGGGAYEAHVRKANGTEVVVLVNEDFEVTAVRRGCPGGPGGPGGPPSSES